MRDPDSLHKPYEYLGEDVQDIIKIDELPEYRLWDYDLNDEKAFKKYIDSIEKSVRGSFEYKQMVNFLRTYMDMNACSFYKNVNNIDTTKVKIEIHHEPLSLFDICLIVYNKRVAFHESLDEEMVAKEVMYIHYQLQVGLIPLAETVHQLVHNQFLFVPTTKVFGKYKEFVEAFKPWMLPEQIDVLTKIEEASLCYEDSYRDILGKHFIYMDLSGVYELPSSEEMVILVKNRIRELVDNPESQREQISENAPKNSVLPNTYR